MDETETGEPPGEALRTLADRINGLIDRAQPARGRPLANAEVVALIEKATGEKYSHTTIWKLRNGQSVNPQLRLIAALSHTFGVAPGFFFAEATNDEHAALLLAQSELLTRFRAAGVTHTQLRAFLPLSPQARQAITDFIEHTGRPPQIPGGGNSQDGPGQGDHLLRNTNGASRPP